MKDLSYHERCAEQRRRMTRGDLVGLQVARGAVHEVIKTTKESYRAWAIRYLWRHLRQVGRVCDRPPVDRLEWRGRCHHLNGRYEQVEWPGGQSTRHTVPLRERARCLLMGRDYPIAGPTGRLP